MLYNGMVFKAHLQSVRVYLGSTKTIDRLCKSGESTVGLWDCTQSKVEVLEAILWEPIKDSCTYQS